MTLVGAYCLQGLEKSMAISAARKFDDNIFPILRLRIGANLVGAIVVAGVGVYYIYSGQTVLGWGVIIASLFFPFRLETIWTSWLNGRNKLTLSAFSKSAIVAIGLLTTLIVIWLPPITLNKTIFWFFSLPAIYTAGLIVYIIRSKDNDIYDRQTIKYGLQVTGASLLAGLVAADKLLLNEYLTITDVAVYSIALIFPQQIKKLFDIFDQFVTPSIYKAKSIAQAWNYLRYKFILISLIFFGIGFGGYFILPVLIPLFFSEQYVDAVPYTRWLWLTFSLSMPPLYLSNILKAQQKVRFVYVSSIGSPLTRFVFYIILLPLGIWGIVLATIVNYVSNGLFMIGSFFYYLRKERLEPVD
jgi:O-antigen/teichoic acid export membrane protein